MSVVSNVHVRVGVKGKIILKALSHLFCAGIVLYTIVGSNSCKNVDKVSDTLIFRYNEDASVSTLDPAFIKSQAEIWIASQIYNGLVDLDSAMQPTPMLARSWEISENKLVYKFHLKSGVQFHTQSDGANKHPRWVTASDVVYSFSRLIDPATASPSAWIFSDKVDRNANPFRAENDSTFILTLNKPFAAMLSLLSTPNCFIVPQEYVKANPSAFGRKPTGTGPFYVKLWEEDVKLVLRRNPDYFETENGKQLPYLEAVNVDFIKNKQTAFMRFVAGEYDFFNGIEGSMKDEILTDRATLTPKFQNKFKMGVKPFLNTEYLGFWLDSNVDGTRNPLQNVHLRRALNYAVDRHALVKYLRNGAGVPGENGFVPPVLFNAPQGFVNNVKKATEELKLAGYPGGKGCPELRITTTSDYLDLMVYIKKYWADIGIKANIEVQTGGMLRQMRNKGNIQVYRGSWFADFADPENFLSCFYSHNFSPGGPNYTHFQNADFDKLYESMALNVNPAMARAADSVLISQAPVLIMYYDKSIRLVQNNVIGLGNDAANRLILKRVRKQAMP